MIWAKDNETDVSEYIDTAITDGIRFIQPVA